jgi:lambda family phage portal protein
MEFIENIIQVISPSTALKRAKARAQTEILSAQLRAFEGATKGRRGDNWNSTGEGENPNSTIERSLATLRMRSRALFKNNPYARKAIKTICLNVVGTGIQPAPMDKSKKAVETAKSEWKSWAASKACDFNGRANIYGLQMQAMRALAMSGECLLIRRRDKSGNLPIKIQLLEGDFLDANKTSVSVKAEGQKNYTVQGVEFDSEGRRVAYWIYERPPSNMTSLQIQSKRIPAEDVIHIFEEERIGQVRGVPFLTASMLRFRDFDDYEDAQLMRQKVAACFTAFVTQGPSNYGESVQDQIEHLERVEPGMIERLAPGESVTFGSPPPAEGYSDYTRKVQQGMSAGAGISYESMTGDLTGVNFSSGRMGWIEAHKQAEDWQWNVFIPTFCEGVWAWFNDALQATGKTNKFIATEWTPQGRTMIDPVKETKGIMQGIAGGLSSWSEAVRQLGYDPDTLLAQMQEDKAKLESAGIYLDWMPEPPQLPAPE